MIDKKIINPEALKLLAAIMRTCPATPLNGGKHARDHLRALCASNEPIRGRQLREGISLVSKIAKCECEGEMDVYTHLLHFVKNETVTRLDIASYFGGQVHSEKIFETARRDLSIAYALKVTYGHLVVPVNIVDLEDGIVVDRNVKTSMGVLHFPQASFKNGDIALMHYGFLIDKTTEDEAGKIASFNYSSELFGEALSMMNGVLDFRKMHYYPRSLKIRDSQ
jgi:hydrogenase maturation factor